MGFVTCPNGLCDLPEWALRPASHALCDNALSTADANTGPGLRQGNNNYLECDSYGAVHLHKCRAHAPEKILYVGACSSFRVPKRQLQEFCQQTGAKAIAGYTADIDWFESAAFELLLFATLAKYQRIDAINRALRNRHAGLLRQLGFTHLIPPA